MKASIAKHIKNFLHAEHVSWQFIRHLAVGGSGVIFNYIAFLVLREHFHFSTLQASAAVHVMLILYIFPLQKYFTYSSSSQLWGEFRRFLVNDAIYFSFDFSFAWFFINFLGLHPWVGKALDLVLITPMSFIIQKYWVFNKTLSAVNSESNKQ